MKRPILGLLAAAILSLGLLGSSPVQATTYSPPAATATPAHHDGEDHPYKHSAHYGQGGTRHHNHDDDDDDDDNGNGHRGRRRCSGLIVIFCS